MRRGNVSSIASLLDGFTSTYDTIGKVMKDKDLRDIANAKPEENLGAQPAGSEADVQRLQDDGASGPEAARLAAGPRSPSTYSLLGLNQDTVFTPAQTTNARQMAQAGVLEKYGDIEGASRLRSQVQQGALAALQIDDMKSRSARDATRFNWETDRENQAQRQRQRDEAFKVGQDDLFKNSTFGLKNHAYATAMDTYSKAKSEYDAKVDAGDVGAVAPVAPARPTFTPSEMMQDSADLLLHAAKYGKATPEQFMALGDKMKAVGDEGYIQALRLAQPAPGAAAGAPLTAVIAAFNKQGSVQIDPSQIVGDKLVDRGAGIKSRLITFKTPDGGTQTIDTYAGLQQFGKAHELFNQAIALHSAQTQDRQVAISGGQLGVAQASLALHQKQYNDTLPERNAKDAEADLRMRLADTEDPKEQELLSAKIAALRTGSRGGGMNADPAHVKEARALVASGAYPDQATALEAVLGKPDKMHQSYVEAGLKNSRPPKAAVAEADSVMQSMGYVKRAGRWAKTGDGATPGIAPPQGAIDKLKQNPALRAQFNEKYGEGAAEKIMGDGWGGPLR